MVALVASLAFSLAPERPLWAVTEFRDLKAGKYGREASEAVAKELAAKDYEIVPARKFRQAADDLRFKSPLKDAGELSRAAAKAMGKADRERVVVAGEVLDFGFRNVKGGRQAVVALRVVAYDVESALPAAGALEKGESEPKKRVNDEELLLGALKNAAAVVIHRLRAEGAPVATIVNTTTRATVINAGSSGGFRAGDSVFVTRGVKTIALGRVGAIEPDQAEIVLERVVVYPSPGDRVHAAFAPPPPSCLFLYSRKDL